MSDAAPRPLLQQAAALRARGLSWPGVGHLLGCDPRELARRASADPTYARWYKAERSEVWAEALAESVQQLREDLRWPGDPPRSRAAIALLAA